MGRRIFSYAVLATLLVGSLIAAAVEADIRDMPGPADRRVLLWLGAVMLSGLGLAVLALRDIRRLRRDAEILAASRERLSGLLDAAPVGLAFFGADGRLDWCNEFCRSVDPDEDLQSVFGLPGSGGQAAAGERRLVDGRWIAVRRANRPDGSAIGLISDITEEKEREADLHAQAEWLRLSLSAAGEWSWETDVLHRVANVSPLRADIDPADLDWMVGHHLADLAPDSDGTGEFALDACLRNMKAHHRLENAQVRFHDGARPRDVRLSGIPAFDDSGVFLGYRGVGAFASTAAPDGHRSMPRDDEPVAVDMAGNGLQVDEPARDADPRTPRLLVVEDSQTNRMLAAAILSRMGYRADLVENGRQAVEAVQEADYGVVLMDVLMPEMDGLEATAKIRALPPPKNAVPIVAMTAHVDASDRQRCLDAGMDEHLEKPIDRRRLAAVLLELVGEGSPAPSAPPAPAEASAPPAPAEASVPPAPVEASATPETPAADAIDDAVIEQLKTDAGPEILAELIATYMAETDERLARMGGAAGDGRFDDVAGDAHAMKSSSGTFGAIQLQMLAARIEAASTNREARQVEAMLAELTALVSETWRAFASRGFHPDGAG